MNIWKDALEASGEGILELDIDSGALKFSLFPSVIRFPELLNEVLRFLKNKKQGTFSGEYRLKSDDGKYRWILIRGKVTNHKFVGTGVDISKRREAENKLRFESEHDSLTGVYRREYFQKVEKKIKKPFTILLVDINGLKEANDKYGHLVGDKLIIDTAQLLHNFVRTQTWKREEDFVVRWGGDEFIVVLNKCGNETAKKILSRLMENVADYNRRKPELKKIKFSVGIGASDTFQNGGEIANVIEKADEEMYLGKLARIEHNRSGIIKYLLNRLDKKDFVRFGHVARLRKMGRKFSDILIKQNRFTIHQGILLDLLCLLHDIGKIEIDDEILNKSGKLTDIQRKLIQTHAIEGSELAPLVIEALQIKLDMSNFPKLVMCHHEYWNGQGYPNGLKGENIPIEDRIFAIIDAFDAMTNNRPYKEKISILKALEQLRKQSGKQFDPELVELLITNKIYN